MHKYSDRRPHVQLAVGLPGGRHREGPFDGRAPARRYVRCEADGSLMCRAGLVILCAPAAGPASSWPGYGRVGGGREHYRRGVAPQPSSGAGRPRFAHHTAEMAAFGPGSVLLPLVLAGRRSSRPPIRPSGRLDPGRPRRTGVPSPSPRRCLRPPGGAAAGSYPASGPRRVCLSGILDGGTGASRSRLAHGYAVSQVRGQVSWSNARSVCCGRADDHLSVDVFEFGSVSRPYNMTGWTDGFR